MRHSAFQATLCVTPPMTLVLGRPLTRHSSPVTDFASFRGLAPAGLPRSLHGVHEFTTRSQRPVPSVPARPVRPEEREPRGYPPPGPSLTLSLDQLSHESSEGSLLPGPKRGPNLPDRFAQSSIGACSAVNDRDSGSHFYALSMPHRYSDDSFYFLWEFFPI
jgi:hypothetical protein